MPRPYIDIDIAEVERLAEVCDNDEEIALNLGISYSTLMSRKREFNVFKEAIKRGKAKANVFVGGKLKEAIENGNMAATIFYMKSRCGWRETSRQEITGADGSPLVTSKVVLEIPDNVRDKKENLERC